MGSDKLKKLYRLCEGFRPGGYGKKRVLLKQQDNLLPDYLARVFLDAGIIELQPPVAKKATKKKTAKKKATKKEKG